jgi:hypothetical protein
MFAALRFLLRGEVSGPMRHEIGSWAMQLAAVFVLCAIAATGAGFLLAAAYLALGTSYAPPTAALLVGLGLMGSAATVVLIVAMLGRRHPPQTALPVPASHASVEGSDHISAPQTLDQLQVLLRDSPPLTVAAIVTGLIVGLFLRTRAR